MSFNEAAGIHRRKRAGGLLTLFPWEVASMRPPEFTGGNFDLAGAIGYREVSASMRPPEFTGGNLLQNGKRQ